MKNLKKLFLLLLVGLAIVLVIDMPVSQDQVIGIYVNNNIGEEAHYAEIPFNRDTLKLNADNTYTSMYYNSGTYKFNSSLFNNQLSISYDYNRSIPKSILEHSDPNYKGETETISGRGGHTFTVSNKLFRPLRIDLVKDMQYFYEKIQ